MIEPPSRNTSPHGPIARHDDFDDTYWDKIDAAWAKDQSEQNLVSLSKRDAHYQRPMPEASDCA